MKASILKALVAALSEAHGPATLARTNVIVEDDGGEGGSLTVHGPLPGDLWYANASRDENGDILVETEGSLQGFDVPLTGASPSPQHWDFVVSQAYSAAFDSAVAAGRDPIIADDYANGRAFVLERMKRDYGIAGEVDLGRGQKLFTLVFDSLEDAERYIATYYSNGWALLGRDGTHIHIFNPEDPINTPNALNFPALRGSMTREG